MTLLGGAAAGWSLAASAQTQPKIPRVGLVLGNTRTSKHLLDAFWQGFRELGHVEGQAILLEIAGQRGA